MEPDSLPPLPPFNYHGYLPEGVHDTTLEQLQARLAINPKRVILWGRLQEFLEWAVATGAFSHAYIDGGFITHKSQPEDIDVILQTRAKYGAEAFAAMEPFFALGMDAIYTKYSVHLHFWCEGFPGGLSDFRRFFQYLRPPGRGASRAEGGGEKGHCANQTMNGAPTFPDWSSVLKRRAELLHQQIAAMQRLVTESGGSEEMMAKACASYYRLLDEIYEKDMPVARALDRSDLLLHLDGEGLQTEYPRLSLVTGIMGDVRKQVGTMIKTLVSSFNEAVELPREIDLGLSSFAQGSLYLGFSLPEPNPGYVVLTGDPLFAASRQALSTLGAVTEHINEPNAYDLIRREFADPKLRDAALSAVGQLAPSGRRGVSSLEIGGRALQKGAWRLLTPQTRLQVRAWLEQPVLSNDVVELRGRVRAIDLDLRRFDLRRIDGGNLPDLRCIYPASFDLPARKWLDATVVVRGRVETYQGAARLLQVQSVEETAPASGG